MAVLFAFLSFFAWGIGGVFSTASSRKLGAFKALFWQLLLAALITSFYIPFAPPLNNARIIVLAIILALVTLAGFLASFQSVRTSNPSLVVSIASSFPVISVLLSLAFLKEKVNLPQATGIILVFIGLFLILFKPPDFKRLKTKKLFSEKGLSLAVLAMVAYGITGAFIKIPVVVIGWFWPIYFFNLTFVILLGYAFVVKKDLSLAGLSKGFAWTIILSMLCEIIGQFGYNAGVAIGAVALVAPISGSSIVLLVILLRIFFKEPMSKQQLTGIIFNVLGIVALSLSFV